MAILDFRRRFLIQSALSLSSLSLAGCGSILYPERVGQPRFGPIDWKVAALDGVGLVLFVVPGLIAFAVDFYNGTIFLPSCNFGHLDADRTDELLAKRVAKETFSQRAVEDVLSEHTGQSIVLSPGTYATRPLPVIDRFWDTASRMRPSFG